MNAPTGPDPIKSVVAAVLVAIYAGISAWLVAGEGENYRKGHRPLIARADPAPSTSTTTTTTTPPVEPAKPPEPPPVEPEPAPPAPVVVPKQVAEPPPPEPTPEPSVVKKPKPPAKAGPKPAPIDPFWEAPEQTKFWALDQLTTSDEAELGGVLNQMVRHVHPPLRVGPLPRRMEEAIEPYLKTVSRKDVNYTFSVLDCLAANTFSHPGGYVYVCRGMFDWLAEDEDYALSFALLHEMAHVDLAHDINNLKQPAVQALKIPTVPLFFGVAIPGGYLDSQVFEADRWAAERMLKAGRSRYEILSYLRKLEDYAKKNGFENEKLKPIDEPKVAPIDNHIRSGPIPRLRIKALKAILDPPSKK